MMVNIELGHINYTNKRNIIDLAGMNLTNEIIASIFEVMPTTEVKKIDIRNNPEIENLDIEIAKEKGYEIIYDEGQILEPPPEE